MFVVFYTKFVYLCIYDLFHILLSLQQTNGSMECMYVCTFLGQGVKLISHIHIMLRLRMGRAIPPFTMYT